MSALNARFERLFQYVKIAGSLLRLRLSRKEQNKQKVREKITQHLARSGGLAMKIGQVIANAGKNPSFAALLKGIPQRPLKSVLSQLEQFPAHPCREDFAHISEKAIAASLGQVHKATLTTGEEVAIKFQYPEMVRTIDSELGITGIIPALGPAKKWNIDVNAYRQALRNDLVEELDYRQEADNQERFREYVQVDGLRIPAVYRSLSSSHVLVQSWEEGVYFDEVLGWSTKDKLQVARTLLMTLWKSIFVLGEVHGDPHMGNCYYQKSADGPPQVILLDFGSTVKMKNNQHLALLKLIVALKEGTGIDPLQCFVAMGFDLGKLAHIEHELPALSRILLRPFLTDGPFDVAEWKVGRGFDLILAERKWWFRSAGPADLFLLMRAFQGVMDQVGQLDAHLPWWQLLVMSIGQKRLQEARDFTLPALPDYERHLPMDAIALNLRIQITKDKVTQMDVRLPPDAALDLESLMPEKVLQEVEFLGWNAESQKNTLIQTRLAPQVIFEKEIEGSHYKVWLE
ncbi:MAG: AarF/UbiB family protein [Cyclobacteriaceae bacterium]|nr:AarF/UbiB family protein [Cyclobacteriaceae bacterium]